MTSTTFFRHDVRVLPCDTCGAPLEAGAGAGRAACAYCGSEQELTAREEVPLVVGPRLTEAERLAQLSKQDAFARPPPEALRGLVLGDRLVPWEVPEALSRWQMARRALATRRDGSAAEELFVLTLALTRHYERQGSLLEARALAEGALDELGEPRQRQVLRAFLARAAALSGELGAAQAWLAGCDAHAADLESDGAYRLARACVHTVEGTFARVIEVLGASPEQVPLPNDLDPAAALLRANAWERMGHVAQASDLLVHLAQHGGPIFHLNARELAELHPELRLAEESSRHAEPRIAALFDERASRAGFSGLGTLIAIGALIVLACVGVIAGSAAGDYLDLGFGLNPITLFAVDMVAISGVILVLLGWVQHRQIRRARTLRRTGRLVPGVIVQRFATGNATMNVPEIAVRVLVLQGATGYLASTEAFFRDPETPALARGALVALRVDHDDPHTFALVL